MLEYSPAGAVPRDLGGVLYRQVNHTDMKRSIDLHKPRGGVMCSKFCVIRLEYNKTSDSDTWFKRLLLGDEGIEGIHLPLPFKN